MARGLYLIFTVMQYLHQLAMPNCRKSVVALLTMTLAAGGVKAGQDLVGDCLYSFSIGEAGTRVEACRNVDLLGIGNDRRVRIAMRSLGIPKEGLDFVGCQGYAFSARPISDSRTSSIRYLITYPLDGGGDYLAPIVHELAHVFQMRSFNGLDAMRQQLDSRAIELSADFIAGLIFSQSLRDTNMGEFLLNLQLIGKYRERTLDAHGTPEQRTSAFRRGAVRGSPYNELDFLDSFRYFVDNDYAIISR